MWLTDAMGCVRLVVEVGEIVFKTSGARSKGNELAGYVVNCDPLMMAVWYLFH